MTTTELVMPRLGLTMTEGTVVRWAVGPGDRFAAGDLLLVVETDKIAYDVEAPAAGVLRDLLVAEGAAASVGTPIARWDLEAEPDAGRPEAPAAAAEPPAAAPALAPETAAAPSRVSAARIIATPLARRLAREAGLELGAIVGTGPGGRIKAADVEHARDTHAAPAPAMAASVAPLAIAMIQVDATRLLGLHAQILRDTALRPSLAHYVVLALARAPADASIVLAADGGRCAYEHAECTSLSAVVSKTSAAPPPMPAGAFLVAAAAEGISFLANEPPQGCAMSIGVGSARGTFAPDAQGAPTAASVLDLSACWRGERDAQALLLRLKRLLENPLALLAG